MAKSLGQIHNVDYQHTVTAPVGGGSAGESNMLLDLSGELTTQLQHMVRCGGNTFKTVGIDIALDLEDVTGTAPSGVVASGRLLYYAPTRGRCLAMREAFDTVKHAMRLQGINHRSNKNYDFRPLIASGLSNATDFKNQASIEILSGSPTPLYIKDQSSSTVGIFENWNNSVSNQQTTTPSFSEGWNIMQQTVPQDYVLNEGTYLEAGGRAFANESYEEIPFQLSISSEDGIASATFQFRPDPALYISVLTGQIILAIDDCVFSDLGAAESVVAKFNITVMVSGWKSIMSDRRRNGSKSKAKKPKTSKKSKGSK